MKTANSKVFAAIVGNSIFDVRNEYIDVTRKDLESLSSSLEKLNRDIKEIKEVFAWVNANNLRTRFSFDFDVIHSGFMPLKKKLNNGRMKNTEDASWSIISLDLADDETMLLPGTLFELIRYFKKKNKSVYSAKNTKFVSAFVEAFQDVDLNKLSDSNVFNAVQKAVFTQAELRRDYFIIELLNRHLVQQLDISVTVDQRVFKQAIDTLSWARRREKSINNRIDALNYAFNISLNDKYKETGCFFILVSNSASLNSLDKDLYPGYNKNSSFIERKMGVVWKPRFAGIFRVLACMTNTYSQAEQLACDMSFQISGFQLLLGEKLKKSKKKHFLMHEMTNSSEFLKLASTFSIIDRLLTEPERRDGNEIRLGNKKYNINDPRKIYADIIKRLKEQVESFKIKVRIAENQGGELSAEIKVTEIKDEYFSSIKKRFELTVGENEAFVESVQRDHSATLWVKSSSSWKDFLMVVDSLRKTLHKKFAAGEYKFKRAGYSFESIDQLLSGRLIIRSELLDDEIEFGFQKELGDSMVLYKNLFDESSAKTIDIAVFMRVDTPLFSASFEGDTLSFHSKYELFDERFAFVKKLSNSPSLNIGEKHIRAMTGGTCVALY